MDPLPHASRRSLAARWAAGPLCFAILALPASPGCAGKTGAHEPGTSSREPGAAPVEEPPSTVEISLRVGGTAEIPATPLRLRLREVVSDSRCPLGVTCVWAGEVSVRIELLEEDGLREAFDLTLGPSGASAASKRIEGGTLDLRAVSPWPREGKRVPPDEYVARILWKPSGASATPPETTPSASRP